MLEEVQEQIQFFQQLQAQVEVVEVLVEVVLQRHVEQELMVDLEVVLHKEILLLFQILFLVELETVPQ
jgi:hypothetical protein